MASKGFVSWSVELLPRAQADAMRKHVKTHSLAALKGNLQWRESSAIEFACQEALKNGNGYTVPEAIELLTEWRTAAGGKLFSDSMELLRLRAAYLKFVDDAEWPDQAQ